MSSEKKITLKSSDGKTFEVEETAALESQTIKHMVEDDCANDEIPLPNVTSTILSKVIEYCKKHAEARSGESTEDDLRTWDADFVKVDQDTLFDLILAANYLNIKSLLDLTCQTVADMIKGKTPEEIRKTFNIKNDPSPENEDEFRRDNLWAFNTIFLKSSDGKRFEVEYEVAFKSQTIKRMVEDDRAKTVEFRLPNVTSTILSKVIEYCRKHVEARSGDDLKTWDADFVKVDQITLFDLINAANYLNIQSLLDLTCLTLAVLPRETASPSSIQE